MRAKVSLCFFAILALFLCTPLHTLAATQVTSDITSNTEWTTDGSPYVVNFTNNQYFPHLLTVTSGVALTVDPGVIVKFGAYNGISVNGTLRVEGTTDNPIIFTSLQDDDAGGDTNDDGDNSTPADEQWMYLEFDTGSIGTFDNAVVRYGGERSTPVPCTGIENYGGMLTIDHTTLAHNGYDGFGQYGGHTTLTNSFISNQSVGITMSGGELDMSDTRIHDNATSGIVHSWNGVLSITHSEIDHNGTGIVSRSRGTTGSIAVSNSSIHNNTDVDGNQLGIDNESQTFGYDEDGNQYINNPGITIDARNNWWGDKSGPNDPTNNVTGTGNGISGDVVYLPWLTSDPFAPPPPPDPCANGGCVSNVLFLPGIEGSRLYEGTGCGKTAEEKLWEPYDSPVSAIRGAGDDKVKNLFLNATGESVCDDIYAKDGGIIDSVGGSNIYQSFSDEMDGLKKDGTINDWKPVAYDWRLSLNDIINNGAEKDGKIYYEDDKGATSTPYIEQTLRELAATSKTGKVTIIAHSNGGLVAKALLSEPGNNLASLVDKIIMVGAPQSGAPDDVGALLYGYDAGIYKFGFPIVSNAVAQQLADNSPMAYHLLPSENYFDSVASDVAHPVIQFNGDGYATEESAYGNTITSSTTLDDFLTASSLNSSLITYSNSEHDALDGWTPPAGIEVDQIAGWGVDTVAGINFYTQQLQLTDALAAFGPQRLYRPIFTEDGDGTVTIPSALLMSTSTGNVKRYWLNLHAYNKTSSITRTHKDLFEVPALQNFIKNIIEDSTSSLPAYISTTQPPPANESKELTFFLHSPLTLQLTDSSGNVTGLAPDDSITENIPDSTYGEFGDVKYITVPEGNNYQLTMHGQDTGSFSLDMQETTGGIITASSTIANVPTTANTLATLTISNGIGTASSLTVDENGDGQNIITINPEVGETVNYVPLENPEPVEGTIPSSAPQVISLPPGSISIPIITISSSSPQIATDSINSPQASTTVAVTSAHLKNKKKLAIAPKKISTPVQGNQQTPQTASVYSGSQQSALKKLGATIYNGLYGFWSALQKLF